MEGHLVSGALKGSRAHVNQDIQEGHIDASWSMCIKLVKTKQEETLSINIRKGCGHSARFPIRAANSRLRALIDSQPTAIFDHQHGAVPTSLICAW